jgi:tetratricopeptide (TPR) repeat protein
MESYTTRDVASLLQIPETRIRSYARAGFVQPARGERNEYRFSFQDLVLLRAAAELARQRVPARRISTALARLKAQLPHGRALSELCIHAAGEEIVVTERGEPPWNPGSGQFHIEFDVGQLATRVARLVPAATASAVTDRGERSARAWFELGLEVEAVAPAEARHAYREALRLEPELEEARINLGRLLHEQGEPRLAEAEYRRVLERCDHAIAAYNLGIVLEDLHRRSEAIQAYTRALAADPNLAEAHYNLARLYEKQGDGQAAIRHFNDYRALIRARGDRGRV